MGPLLLVDPRDLPLARTLGRDASVSIDPAREELVAAAVIVLGRDEDGVRLRGWRAAGVTTPAVLHRPPEGERSAYEPVAVLREPTSSGLEEALVSLVAADAALVCGGAHHVDRGARVGLGELDRDGGAVGPGVSDVRDLDRVPGAPVDVGARGGRDGAGEVRGGQRGGAREDEAEDTEETEGHAYLPGGVRPEWPCLFRRGPPGVTKRVVTCRCTTPLRNRTSQAPLSAAIAAPRSFAP